LKTKREGKIVSWKDGRDKSDIPKAKSSDAENGRLPSA